MSCAGPHELLRGPQSQPGSFLRFPVWVPIEPQRSGVPSAIGKAVIKVIGAAMEVV